MSNEAQTVQEAISGAYKGGGPREAITGPAADALSIVNSFSSSVDGFAKKYPKSTGTAAILQKAVKSMMAELQPTTLSTR